MVIKFAAVPKSQFLDSDVTIAASMFKNVFGESAATKALPALVAISALGHLLGIAFTVRMLLLPLSPNLLNPKYRSSRDPGTRQRWHLPLPKHYHAEPAFPHSHSRAVCPPSGNNYFYLRTAGRGSI